MVETPISALFPLAMAMVVSRRVENLAISDAAWEGLILIAGGNVVNLDAGVTLNNV